jgi:hypothetical protein
MQTGLLSNLQNGLTNVASIELDYVLCLLRDFSLNDDKDDKFLHHGSSFSTKQAYALLHEGQDIDANATLIWDSKVQIKV